jgi:hypothetical protein
MYYKSLKAIHETPTGWQFVCTNTFDGVVNSFEIHRTDVNPYQDAGNWARGQLIQNAFPYLDSGQREMLITGITPEMWDKYNTEEL